MGMKNGVMAPKNKDLPVKWSCKKIWSFSAAGSGEVAAEQFEVRFIIVKHIKVSGRSFQKNSMDFLKSPCCHTLLLGRA